MDELFNALKTAYGKGSKYGVSDEAISGVAALGATANLSEEQIAAFVAAAEPIFRKEQSEADKVRSSYAAKLKELEAAKAELEAKLNGNQPPEPNPEPKPQEEVPAWAKLLLEQNQALAEQNKTFAEKLTAFETTRAKETAVAALDKFCADWDYAGGFPKERDEAKRIALKFYKAGGEQMNGEQLIAAFREEFDPAVKSKGVTDFSQPFKSDGGAGTKPDFSADVELMKSEGVDFGE